MRLRPARSLAIAFAIFISTSTFAQKVTGTISGTVTDPQGAVVPGAAVTIVGQATNAARNAMTGSSGTYAFPEVEAGIYTLKVTKDGFRDSEVRNVEVHVSSVATINVQMGLGTATQEVSVEAQGVQLNTENGEVGDR